MLCARNVKAPKSLSAGSIDAARRRQISRGVEEASRAEGEGNREWAFDFGGEAQYPHPVPYWSWRPLCPGEWREGTGVEPEGRVVGASAVRIRERSSYGERMRVLAEASGTFGTLLNLGWGRYIGPRPVLPQGHSDTTGVT